MKRCIEDTIFYDESLAEHWWRSIGFLNRIGTVGIVLNPETFQFFKEEVAFLVFKVSGEMVEA